MGAGVLDQNLSHYPGGDPEEMGAVLPVGCVRSGQPQVRLMDQSRALQGMVAALALQIMVGQAAQFVVDQRHEGFQGLPVAPAPTNQ